LRVYLVGLLVLVAVLIGGAVAYQRARSIDSAALRSERGTAFKAGLAASAIRDAVSATQSDTAELAANPAVLQLLGSKPMSGCTPGFTPPTPFSSGHLDVIAKSGEVLCSSQKLPSAAVYAGSTWLRSAVNEPRVIGPVTDLQTGDRAILVTAPVHGTGAVAGFLDLDGLPHALATRFGGSIATHFALTPPQRGATTVADQGGRRLTASAVVRGLGWNVDAWSWRSDAVADAKSLNDQLLWYLLMTFVALVVAVQLLYLKLTRPIQRLSAAVRRAKPGEVPAGLAVSGPAEVVALGEDFTGLARAVRAELTGRRRAEAAHAAAEKERDAQAAMLSLIIDSSPALIYVKDLAGRYLMVNSAFEKAVGLEQHDLLGKTDLEIDPKRAVAWRANDVLARTGIYRLQEEAEQADGVHYFDTAKFPLSDASGEVYAICGVSLDDTEQQNAIAATAEARDAALQAYEAISQARDAALAANAAKSAFLASMSHEIRTPLNAVIGMSDLLGQTALDGQQAEFVDTVRRSGEALLGVINDILDFSKIDSGQLDLELAPFNLRDEIEGCLDLVAGQAAGKGLDLLCYIDDSCPHRVAGDAVRLRQILTNLLANAVKFTEHGHVLVEAQSEPDGDGKLVLKLCVTDTGIGISDTGRERLFKSFSQVDPSTTRLYGGTGLGLAISQRLATAMGGDIEVSSAPGQGSKFTVTVMLTRCPESAQVTQTSALAAPVLAGCQVLLVDDSPTNLRILELQLSRLGMECELATSSREALTLVNDGLEYDVAILDLHLPDLSGAELARTLTRSGGTSAGSPLILLASIGNRPEGLDALFTAIMTKPVKSTVLRDTLTAVIGGTAPVNASIPAKPVTPAPAEVPKRILLAEDNPVNQRVAQLMLHKLGHVVDVVSDGVAALAAVERQEYDVVLMDVEMPHMDGLEATRRIRAQARNGRQPHIVALTASALVEDREACVAAGMEAYLTKPVRAWELQTILDRTAISRTQLKNPERPHVASDDSPGRTVGGPSGRAGGRARV
jgi:PAS domain S-box-containing protein